MIRGFLRGKKKGVIKEEFVNAAKQALGETVLRFKCTENSENLLSTNREVTICRPYDRLSRSSFLSPCLLRPNPRFSFRETVCLRP